MPKPPKKLGTEDKYIDRAEETLGIKYPEVIREKLKERNGFEWAGYNFYCVLDDDDKAHTFDDVVRENTNDSSGWKEYLPEDLVVIASDSNYCLCLKNDQSQALYFYDNNKGETELLAEGDEIQSKLEDLDKDWSEGSGDF